MFPLATSASVERPEGRNILLQALRHMPVSFQVPLNWSHVMWVFHHTTKAPDYGFWGFGCKHLLSPRRPVRVGCGRLRPCEKSNMFDISPDPNRLFFPAINKMSSPRLPQASSDQIYTVLCCPRPPATLSPRPLIPDP